MACIIPFLVLLLSSFKTRIALCLFTVQNIVLVVVVFGVP